jgi:hypothetical protein
MRKPRTSKHKSLRVNITEAGKRALEALGFQRIEQHMAVFGAGPKSPSERVWLESRLLVLSCKRRRYRLRSRLGTPGGGLRDIYLGPNEKEAIAAAAALLRIFPPKVETEERSLADQIDWHGFDDKSLGKLINSMGEVSHVAAQAAERFSALGVALTSAEKGDKIEIRVPYKAPASPLEAPSYPLVIKEGQYSPLMGAPQGHDSYSKGSGEGQSRE